MLRSKNASVSGKNSQWVEYSTHKRKSTTKLSLGQLEFLLRTPLRENPKKTQSIFIRSSASLTADQALELPSRLSEETYQDSISIGVWFTILKRSKIILSITSAIPCLALRDPEQSNINNGTRFKGQKWVTTPRPIQEHTHADQRTSPKNLQKNDKIPSAF